LWDFNFTTKRIGAANGEPQAGPASAVGTAISAYLGDRESRGILIVLVPPIALRQCGRRIRRSRIPDEIWNTLREIDCDPIGCRRRRLCVRFGRTHQRDYERERQRDCPWSADPLRLAALASGSKGLRIELEAGRLETPETNCALNADVWGVHDAPLDQRPALRRPQDLANPGVTLMGSGLVWQVI